MSWYRPRDFCGSFSNFNAPDRAGLPKIPQPLFRLTTAGDVPENEQKSYTDLNGYSRANPFQTRISQFTLLSHLDAVKRIYSVKIDVSALKDWKWMPGDAFGIVPENDPEFAAYAIERLSLNPNQIIHLEVLGTAPKESLAEFILSYGKPLTVSELVTKHVDWSYFPKKACLRHMAEFCSDQQEKNTLLYFSSKEGSSDYMRLAGEHTTILDFLSSFKSCQPDLASLLSHLPLLHPRFYSIATSPLTDPHTIEFVFSTFEYKTPEGYLRKGIASSWLERTQVVHIVPRPNLTRFIPPEDPQVPFLMICAGTGISPFIGFLRHFHALGLKTKGWLLYGFRNVEHDYLFKEEIVSYLEAGNVERLTIAVSRQPELGHPKYVQDALLAHQELVYSLLSQNEQFRIYICGDELTMIKGVNDAIIQMLVNHQSISVKEATDLCRQWTTEGKIVKDVWI